MEIGRATSPQGLLFKHKSGDNRTKYYLNMWAAWCPSKFMLGLRKFGWDKHWEKPRAKTYKPSGRVTTFSKINHLIYVYGNCWIFSLRVILKKISYIKLHVSKNEVNINTEWCQKK